MQGSPAYIVIRIRPFCKRERQLFIQYIPFVCNPSRQAGGRSSLQFCKKDFRPVTRVLFLSGAAFSCAKSYPQVQAYQFGLYTVSAGFFHRIVDNLSTYPQFSKHSRFFRTDTDDGLIITKVLRTVVCCFRKVAQQTQSLHQKNAENSGFAKHLLAESRRGFNLSGFLFGRTRHSLQEPLYSSISLTEGWAFRSRPASSPFIRR